MKKLLIGSTIYLSVISQSNLTAAVTPDEVIQACEEALNACDTYSITLEEVIRQQDKALELAAKEQARLRAQRDSILRNPFVIGLLGVTGGLILGVTLTR